MQQEINGENAKILSTIKIWNWKGKTKKCSKRIHTNENDLKSMVRYIVACAALTTHSSLNNINNVCNYYSVIWTTVPAIVYNFPVKEIDWNATIRLHDKISYNVYISEKNWASHQCAIDEAIFNVYMKLNYGFWPAEDFRVCPPFKSVLPCKSLR